MSLSILLFNMFCKINDVIPWNVFVVIDIKYVTWIQGMYQWEAPIFA